MHSASRRQKSVCQRWAVSCWAPTIPMLVTSYDYNPKSRMQTDCMRLRTSVRIAQDTSGERLEALKLPLSRPACREGRDHLLPTCLPVCSKRAWRARRMEFCGYPCCAPCPSSPTSYQSCHQSPWGYRSGDKASPNTRSYTPSRWIRADVQAWWASGVPAITHAIYEAVLQLKKDACESGGIR